MTGLLVTGAGVTGRWWARASIGAGLVVVLAGCGGSEVPQAEAEELAASAEQVRRSTADVVAALTAQGLEPAGASSSWANCADDGSELEHDSQFRLDSTSGAPDAEALASAVTGALAWEPVEAPPGDEDRTVVRFADGDLELELNTYLDEGYVLGRVLGPCRAVTEDDAAGLDRGAQEIDTGSG